MYQKYCCGLLVDTALICAPRSWWWDRGPGRVSGSPFGAVEKNRIYYILLTATQKLHVGERTTTQPSPPPLTSRVLCFYLTETLPAAAGSFYLLLVSVSGTILHTVVRHRAGSEKKKSTKFRPTHRTWAQTEWITQRLRLGIYLQHF